MAPEAKSYDEMVAAAIMKKQVAASASESDDFQAAAKVVERGNRQRKRELNREDRSERIEDGIDEQLAKTRAIAARPKSEQDELGNPTALSEKFKGKLAEEQKEHKATKTALRKAESQLKAQDASIKKLEAALAKANGKAAKKASKGGKAQASTTPAAPANG